MTRLHSSEYAPHLYANMDVPNLHAEHAVILQAVERCEDPARLRQWIYNTHKRGAHDVRNAAFRRLAFIANESPRDNLENAALRILAVYRTRLTSGHCFSLNMAKYQLLYKTDGARFLIEDMAGRQRFMEISRQLVEMDLAELTLEAVMIRFRTKFFKESVTAAENRLVEYGFKGRF